MNTKKYLPSYTDSIIDLLKYSILYLLSLSATWYYRNHYLSIVTIPLLSLMNTRTFIIYHDCGHNSYTPRKKLNYIIGSVLGIFVFTPFCWTYNHHNHHLTSGNKEEKLKHGFNETIIYTFKEFNNMETKKKLIVLI